MFEIAKSYGWSDDRRPADPADDALAALLGTSTPAVPDSPLTFLSPADCAASNPRTYIIKGLIAERDVACIVGAPGAGKTVLAPALAYAVAQGREAHGRRTKAGCVFYVAAEDEHGMRGRVTALRGEHGDAENFTLVGGVSDLLNETIQGQGQGSPHFNALLKAVEERRPALIVIDTLSMSFPGLEENSAEGMGRVVAVARALTKWGAAVVLIHHDTKDGQQGLPRGHSLLNGALDVSIHLRKDGDIVRGRLTKNRNGACDVDLAFSIRGVEIGHDEDGDPLTAPLCIPLNANALKPAGPRLAPSERAALDSIKKIMGKGDSLPVATWREAAKDDLSCRSLDFVGQLASGCRSGRACQMPIGLRSFFPSRSFLRQGKSASAPCRSTIFPGARAARCSS
ncbi:MAG: AAA family ATPase [Defluviimonas sp.]|nr:AAA family ATPase [Defluviimonas sp.]